MTNTPFVGTVQVADQCHFVAFLAGFESVEEPTWLDRIATLFGRKRKRPDFDDDDPEDKRLRLPSPVPLPRMKPLESSEGHGRRARAASVEPERPSLRAFRPESNREQGEWVYREKIIRMSLFQTSNQRETQS